MKNQQVVPPVQRGGTEGLHPWDLRAESPQVVCSQRWSSGGSCYKDTDDMLIMVTYTITRLHQNTVVEKKLWTLHAFVMYCFANIQSFVSKCTLF